MMGESKPEGVQEVPGGARRADTFLLVIATIIAASGIVGMWNSRPPFIPLFFAALWMDTLKRWLRHVRPQYASAAEYFGTLVLGAALYAGWPSW
ncbi:MAG TPA: hypothetical protein VJW73_12180 [Gemmatimonadaceae bacterium]|nr:hypothetical protein [Gemmatimonadaceae bacterium]